MCDRTSTFVSTTGVTQDGGRSLDSVISTAAHELGHIFNMLHDDGMLLLNCVCCTSAIATKCTIHNMYVSEIPYW